MTETEKYYTLYIPFSIVDKREITITGKHFSTQSGKLEIDLQKHSTNKYICRIKGFESEFAAKNYFKRFWVGLAWVMLNHDLAFSIALDFDKVVYAEDPKLAAESLNKNFALKIEKVDGLISEGRPAVYPSDKIIKVFGTSANFLMLTPIEKFHSTLMKGINEFNSLGVFDNSKLRTALDLYNSYFYEYSLKAKFLTLIMALEVLTSSTPKSQNALHFLEKWKAEIGSEKSKLNENGEDFESLEALEKELLFRKKNSLRSRMRELVYESLKEINDPNAEICARKAVNLYDTRSELVHEGTLPNKVLKDALSESKKLTKLILKIKISKVESNYSAKKAKRSKKRLDRSFLKKC